jgi:NitT/TauT family transport system ATP-binding protein
MSTVVTSVRERIVVEDVCLSYGSVVAARDLTFDVRPGEFVSLIGPSGCGKSTALRAIGGLLTPTSGTVRVGGTPVTGPRPAEIAFVFQDLALYPWRSALRNVEIALQFAGVDRKTRRARATQALEAVGLGDVPHRFPAQLSGGMRQRVAIARALVSDADVLLLDEPFAALDEQTRLKLGGQLLRLLEEHGKTVVFVTHSLAEAAYLSDRIVVMGPRPATIKAVIPVGLPRPRDPSVMRTSEFHALTDQLSALLLDES